MQQISNKNRSAKILTYKQLKHEFDLATVLFKSKESDTNWQVRMAFFEKVKAFLPSDDAKAHKKELIDKIHEVIPGVFNTVASVRTTLIEEALSLAEAIGTYLGDSINMHTNEAILRFLMNESSVTKKAIATRAFEATNNYLAKTRFRPKVLTLLCTRAQDKNPQLREFALGYITTVLSVHGPANKSRLIEHADLMQALATSLQKGLVDAIPTVRSACKATYYVFEEHWPTAAFELTSKLDIATQRRLGINTTTSKSAKPLLRRTSKSTASAIKKPASNINRAARLDIRAAMQKPSKATSLFAQTPSLTSSSSSQEITPEPADPSFTAAENMPQPSRRGSRVLPSPTSSSSNEGYKSSLHHTQKTSAGVIKKPKGPHSITHTAKLVKRSRSVMSPISNTDITARTSSVSNTSPTVAATKQTRELALDTQRRLGILPTTVVPRSTSSHSVANKKETDKASPLHLTRRTSAGAIKEHVGLNRTANLVKRSSSAMSTISNTDISARSNSVSNTSFTAATTTDQPRHSDLDTQRHLDIVPTTVVPTPTGPHSVDNNKDDGQASLHLTEKTSSDAIKQHVGPHSISKPAELVERSHNALPLIPNIDIPARSNSVSNSSSTAAATTNQPHESNVETQRRSDSLPAGPAISNNDISAESSSVSTVTTAKLPCQLDLETQCQTNLLPAGPEPISNNDIPPESSSQFENSFSVTTAKQPCQMELETQCRLNSLPAGSVPIPNNDIPPEPSSVHNNPFSVTTTKQPHQKGLETQRRLDIIPTKAVPKPTRPHSLANDKQSSKSPLHLTRKTSAGAIKKPVGPHSISQTAKLVKRSHSALSSHIPNTKVPAKSSSVSNKSSTGPNAKQPRQLDPDTQRRLGIVPTKSVPKPTRLLGLASDKDSGKSPLHLTRKTSAGAINKPVGPHSISQTARLVKRSHSALSPTIPKTDISVRSNSVANERSTATAAKQPRLSDLDAQRRLGIVATKSKLKKNSNLFHKYDHVKSRYKNV